MNLPNDLILLNNRALGMYLIQPDNHRLREYDDDHQYRGNQDHNINEIRPLQIPIHERNELDIVNRRKKMNNIMKNVLGVFVIISVTIFMYLLYQVKTSTEQSIFSRTPYQLFCIGLGVFVIIGGEKMII